MPMTKRKKKKHACLKAAKAKSINCLTILKNTPALTQYKF